MNRDKISETMLTIVTGLIVLFYIFHSRYLLAAAAILGLVGIFSHTLSQWITWLWLKLAEGLGYVMPRVLLSLIFYLFLFPIAMIYRLTHHDGLQLKRKTKGSYFVERKHRFTPADIRNPW
jgi:hypothetical protein